MKKLYLSLSMVLVLVLAGLGLWKQLSPHHQGVSVNLSEYQKAASQMVQEVKREVSLPPPLRSDSGSRNGILSPQGVIQETNVQRRENGESPLIENSQLNRAAEYKLRDMFQKQYFEHTAPDGTKASDLAEEQGYAYIAIGENLALGHFVDDEALVLAWMESPGHRENILSRKFTQIGVAVAQGTFEDEITWLAVQIFGRPESDCLKPSPSDKVKIDTNKNTIDALAGALEAKKKEIESISKSDRDIYNVKVNEYNQLARQYNALIEITKELVEQYNTEVQIYNECVTRT